MTTLTDKVSRRRFDVDGIATVSAAAEPTGEVTIPQYSRRSILAIWAAAAVPMGALAWVGAPRLASSLSGPDPLVRSLLILLTAGLIWQFVLVLGLVGFEQRTLRWATLREALWLRAPRSPRTGRAGGRTWLIVIPLIVALAAEEMIPTFSAPAGRDFGVFLGSDAGQSFMNGAWGWFALIVVLMVFNTVLGEELLFRGFLLPRMNGAFGDRDWLANGILFAAYHVHVPWVILPGLADTLILAYPAKRYRSTWVAIAVHSAQSLFFTLVLLGLVL